MREKNALTKREFNLQGINSATCCARSFVGNGAARLLEDRMETAMRSVGTLLVVAVLLGLLAAVGWFASWVLWSQCWLGPGWWRFCSTAAAEAMTSHPAFTKIAGAVG
jgi:hypothetical protein